MRARQWDLFVRGHSVTQAPSWYNTDEERYNHAIGVQWQADTDYGCITVASLTTLYVQPHIVFRPVMLRVIVNHDSHEEEEEKINSNTTTTNVIKDQERGSRTKRWIPSKAVVSEAGRKGHRGAAHWQVIPIVYTDEFISWV
jgi:hypothetical protein